MLGYFYKISLTLQVRKITTRVNTVNGRSYSADPTIFSWCAGILPTSVFYLYAPIISVHTIQFC